MFIGKFGIMGIIDRDFSREFVFTATRSSGPGGQNVNKVSTKVELRFDVYNSAILSEEEKEILRIRLQKKISAEGFLIIVSQSERTQLKNKEKTIEKFHTLIWKALTPVKKRRPTRPSAASKEKRIVAKKMQGEKKARRKL
jgi:ribosome-associated protein